MKSSTSLLKGLGTLVVVGAAIMGTTSATSLVVPQTMICAASAHDYSNAVKSLTVTPYYDNKPLSTDLWSSEQNGRCISVARDWLLGAAQPGTSFYIKALDKKGITNLIEMRDVAMFRADAMKNIQMVTLNYHINDISDVDTNVPALIGTVSNEFWMDDKGKLSTVVQKGIYRSDMQDIYALDTMRQIGATKYTRLEDFKGKNTVTREQAAKFFVAAWAAIHSGEKIPTSTAGCSFTDAKTMDHSLISSVSNACQLGLMKGSAGKFNPQNTLTLAEAITILIRMQYGKMEERAIWYSNYFKRAYEVELFAHFAYNPHMINEATDTISREMIAFLIRRLLEINNITPKYYNTI